MSDIRSYFLLCLILGAVVSSAFAQQDDYTYGTVIGGEKETQNVQSFLDTNEEGIRVTLINSARRSTRSQGGGGSNRGVQIYNVPKDTDYLELLVFKAGINPRYIRQNKIKILRIDSTGAPPYRSEHIERYWTTHDFSEEYEEGGPFSLVQPGDIIIVQGRGLINRPFFDPISDIRFLLSLSSLALSAISVYNLAK